VVTRAARPSLIERFVGRKFPTKCARAPLFVCRSTFITGKKPFSRRSPPNRGIFVRRHWRTDNVFKTPGGLLIFSSPQTARRQFRKPARPRRGFETLCNGARNRIRTRGGDPFSPIGDFVAAACY